MENIPKSTLETGLKTLDFFCFFALFKNLRNQNIEMLLLKVINFNSSELQNLEENEIHIWCSN